MHAVFDDSTMAKRLREVRQSNATAASTSSHNNPLPNLFIGANRIFRKKRTQRAAALTNNRLFNDLGDGFAKLLRIGLGLRSPQDVGTGAFAGKDNMPFSGNGARRIMTMTTPSQSVNATSVESNEASGLAPSGAKLALVKNYMLSTPLAGLSGQWAGPTT